MNGFCLFPAEEYEARLENIRAAMDAQAMDVCLFTSPENICYLTGLDHQGYFGPHILIVPRYDDLILIARLHEGTTIGRQVGNARFQGYSDTVEPGAHVSQILVGLGMSKASIGIQRASLCFPPTISDSLTAHLPGVKWKNADGIVESLRILKSSREIAYVRRAAGIADKIVQTAIDVAGEGISEREIAASVHDVMIREGGEYPGFGPFIRSGERLPYEHEVWSDRRLQYGDQLVLEMAGCSARYHAPMGRLIYVGSAPEGTTEVEGICIEAQDRAVEAMRPGATGAEVYNAWQGVLDQSGLSNYRRHHCGYVVGIAFPPSWTGGIGVVSLHPESDLVLKSGMVFHQLSWLLGSDIGDYFVSDTMLVTENGCEKLTNTSRKIITV